MTELAGVDTIKSLIHFSNMTLTECFSSFCLNISEYYLHRQDAKDSDAFFGPKQEVTVLNMQFSTPVLIFQKILYFLVIRGSTNCTSLHV